MRKKILVTRSSMPPYEEYIKAIKPLWDSHWITNMGDYHNELEEKLKRYLDVPYLSLMVNGHMALELAIQAFEFPDGAEVITTPFTFISTTHAIIRNHLNPVFCDIKKDDFTIDENKIEKLVTRKTVAILPVHVYGNICNIEIIQNIADKYGLKVIYDAAHAFGVKKAGIGIGNFGDATIFSFHATKVFNTIEGGAVAFKNEALYKKLYYLKNFGIKNEDIISDVGANAKMNEFQAIMGLCNLRYIEEYIQKRKHAVELYHYYLKGVQGIEWIKLNKHVDSNYAYFPIFIDKNRYGLSRNELLILLEKKNIYTRKYFFPLTVDSNCYKEEYNTELLDNARSISNCVLALPLYSDIEEETIYNICSIIRKAGK